MHTDELREAGIRKKIGEAAENGISHNRGQHVLLVNGQNISSIEFIISTVRCSIPHLSKRAIHPTQSVLVSTFVYDKLFCGLKRILFGLHEGHLATPGFKGNRGKDV